MTDTKGLLIRADIERLKIIEGGQQDCFKPASYDLRVGDEFVRPGDTDRLTRKPIVSSAQSFAGGELIIPAFSSVIVSSYETIKLPSNVVGKFDLRIRQAIRGLMVQMGTQIEPHYHGRVFALLHNITNSPIKLRYAVDRIFTAEFNYTSTEVPITDDATIKNQMSLGTYLEGHALSATFDSIIADEIKRHKALEEKVSDVSTVKLGVVALGFTVLFSALVPIIVTLTLTFLVKIDDETKLRAQAAKDTADQMRIQLLESEQRRTESASTLSAKAQQAVDAAASLTAKTQQAVDSAGYAKERADAAQREIDASKGEIEELKRKLRDLERRLDAK